MAISWPFASSEHEIILDKPYGEYGDVNAIDEKLKFIVKENHYLSISKKNREQIRKRFIREELVTSFYDDISW